MDPMMPYFVGAVAAILLVGVILRRLRQPHVIAYLVAGVLIGPYGIGLVDDVQAVARLGEIGVVLLLFFAGMEISLPRLLERWRVPVLGACLQIGLSLGVAMSLGYAWDWPMGRGVLLGFVLSLSSTGVVMKLLRDRNESDGPVGTDVIGVLLVQDLAVIPMLVVIGLMAGDSPGTRTLVTQIVGGVLVLGLIAFLGKRERVRMPFANVLRGDHELQIFSAFLLAFGLALVTALMGLSAALGAFLAGLIVGAARETEWVTEALHPFHIMLLAFFFVSVGMMIDLSFLRANAMMIGVLVTIAMLINTAINTSAFRVLGLRWGDALYGATLLAQIGEFSFVLAAVGKESGLISDFGYQMTIAIIAISLLISPFWIELGRILGGHTYGSPGEHATAHRGHHGPVTDPETSD